MDSSYIPPCKRVLVEKINRTNYIATIWKSATCSQPLPILPESSGWTLVDGHHRILWLNGECSPRIVKVSFDGEEDEDEQEEIEESNENDSGKMIFYDY